MVFCWNSDRTDSVSGDMCTAGLNPTLHRYTGTPVFCTTCGRSDVVNLDCSVPQRSIVGPQQFSAYTEDMCEPLRDILIDTTSTLMINSYKRAPASLSCSHVFADSRDVSCRPETGAAVDVFSLMPTRLSSLFSAPRPILNVSIKLMLTFGSIPLWYIHQKVCAISEFNWTVIWRWETTSPKVSRRVFITLDDFVSWSVLLISRWYRGWFRRFIISHWLLQFRVGRATAYDGGISTTSPSDCSPPRRRVRTAWSCDWQHEGSALAASAIPNKIQAVRSDACGSRKKSTIVNKQVLLMKWPENQRKHLTSKAIN